MASSSPCRLLSGVSKCSQPALTSKAWQSGRRLALVYCTLVFGLAGPSGARAQAVSDRFDESDSNFFFGTGASGSTEQRAAEDRLAETAFDHHPESSGIREDGSQADSGWIDQDISNLFPELRVIDEVSAGASMRRVERARGSLRDAQNLLNLAEREAGQERVRLEASRPQGGWQRLDYEEAIRRREAQIRNRARMQAVAHLVKAINELDAVGNPEVATSAPFKELLSLVYRNYVKLQFRLQNFSACQDVLERYLKIRPEHAQDPEAHRLLAACYRRNETLAHRMQDLRMSDEYRRRKNEHLLKYALLAFGPSSAEYTAIHARVERDGGGNPVQQR